VGQGGEGYQTGDRGREREEKGDWVRDMDTNEQKMDYKKQAQDFMDKTKTTFSAKLMGHIPYSPDDKESRDVYEVTLERKGRKAWSFRFGASIFDSGRDLENKPYSDMGRLPPEANKAYNSGKSGEVNGYKISHGMGSIQKIRKAPTAYDVLACLTKNDPGTFEDFCADYGYDDDSRKAEGIYREVQKEWANVERVFGDVIEELQEIN
jgi:hypothetical protein